ncbi:MAG: alpha/beta hydrolase [Novosphingobium sp.]
MAGPYKTVNIARRTVLASTLASTLLPGMVSAQTAPPDSGQPVPPGLLQPTETIDLWPKGVPDAPRPLPAERVEDRASDSAIADRVVLNTAVPRMVVFRPDRPNGAAVLIAPGGGYRLVVVDKEGYEIGRWLAARGFTAFVLFYRLPGDGWTSGPDTPLIDAQRAMRLIRHRARDFAIDPERVAAMGFSAGGHVCASLSTRFAAPVHQPVDAADRLSARPICAAPIYPVISRDPAIAHAGSRRLLLGENPTPGREMAWSPDQTVPGDAPPHFLIHAQDDASVPVQNSLRFYEALRARKIPVEMHLFAHGGHGFGLRNTIGKPVEAWPDLWRAWARTTGLG